MRRNFSNVGALTILSFLILNFALAEIPHLIQYQGKATDKAGSPATGDHTIEFRLYDHVSSGSRVWSETHTAVPIYNGLFFVLLGGVTPLDLAFKKPYWLSLEIDSDGEFTPRQLWSSSKLGESEEY